MRPARASRSEAFLVAPQLWRRWMKNKYAQRRRFIRFKSHPVRCSLAGMFARFFISGNLHGLKLTVRARLASSMNRQTALRTIDRRGKMLRPFLLHRRAGSQPQEYANRPCNERKPRDQPTGLASQLRVLCDTPDTPDNEREESDVQKQKNDVCHSFSANSVTHRNWVELSPRRSLTGSNLINFWESIHAFAGLRFCHRKKPINQQRTGYCSHQPPDL